MLSQDGGANGAAAMPDKAVDALKALCATLASGHSLAHTQQLVASKLVPALLSTSALLKPPRQSVVKLSLVSRRLQDVWAPAILTLATRLRPQGVNLPQLLLRACMERLGAKGRYASLAIGSTDEDAVALRWQMDLLLEWTLLLLRVHTHHALKDEPSLRTNQPAATIAIAAPAQEQPTSNSRKRSHTAMSTVEAPTAAPVATSQPPTSTSTIDDLVHICLTQLNPWLVIQNRVSSAQQSKLSYLSDAT
jgi:hypothetical protein